ncbi:MAG: ABC transporter ATP-binding protein [Armatimonadetes bacterium]|nr:ATP-binding cassette domain-containing protein [Armatimonadota bacterium]MBS1700430.1 ABC transporter ATP-binding protein [Armatimonadota bacterium]MBS1725307.1 ABC transporter ATP-binding protein [Armatimonadota bacterium]
MVDVVKQLDLHVEEGEIFGFLGPNGAGKTTTIKMLLSIIEPTAGEGYVLGKELGDYDVHKIISYVPERPYYYEYMTGMEILKFYGSLFGISDTARMDMLLEKVNLHRDKTKTISQFSKGMQQRIGLAQALLNDPKLLFLDEPTGGLDPIAHREIRDLILSFREEGRTVFISSHELSEVELICDRVAIINHGVIARQGKLTELLRGGRVELSVSGVKRGLLEDFKINDSNLHEIPSGLLFDVPEESDINALIDGVRSNGGSVISVVPRKKRLEDLFVETVTAK